MDPQTLHEAPPCAPPLRSIRRPHSMLPPNSCDSHLHILGPARKYPYAADRVYTPPDCLLADYRTVQRYLGVTRCVLVQASVYGSDNRSLLDALAELGDSGGDVARGVVVLEGRESREELDRMHRLGVRGARLNLVDLQLPRAELPKEQLLRLADLIGPLGWHLELLMHVDRHPDMEEVLNGLGVQIVFGHMGYLSRDVAEVRHPGMQAMLRLMKSGRAWAKATAPYRVAEPPGYERAGEIARWLASQCLDRLVWGSDWPHVMVKTAMPHDADLLDAVARWLPHKDQQVALFAGNPARLYGWR
jgi:predicted TIM-barrel fold metal-dependent hydrolase